MQTKKSNFVKKVSSAELRYNYLTRKLRQIKDLSKDVQVDVAWLFNEVKSYGFDFFANHYQWERMDQLEKILNRELANNQQVKG